MKRNSFFLLAICLFILHFNAFCWGFFGHRQINYHAVFLLPPEMIRFYKSNIQYLADHATDPDKRRYAVLEEGPRHYIDMDHYGSFPFSELPRSWENAKGKFTEDSLQAHGIAPWWIQVIYRRLIKAFKDKDAKAILKNSSDLGHYLGDIHVPLHTSSNHNGQKTGQTGIHGFWESRLPEMFAIDQYDMVIGKAMFIRDPLDFTWRRIYESALASDSVLRMEKGLSVSIPSDKKFAYEERNGVVVRQYANFYATRYHHILNGMVERRMRSAIFSVASFWYSAWLEAGQPDLKTLIVKELSAEEHLEMDSLQKAWHSGKIIGRSCAN
jgi:hypothetical protein